MRRSSLMPDDANYAALLDDLKIRIRSAQVKAALAVNQELILLYWHIGCEVLMRQQEQGWGAKVIDRLSQDLKREFPDMKGFSSRSLKYMRAMAEAYPDEEMVRQLVAQIPWGHNQKLLNKLDDQEQRLWYARKAMENGWSRDVLEAQIDSGLYQQKRGAVTNFERTLPKPQSDLAHDIIKDPYHLDFLLVDENIRHQDLKRALVEHMRDFLLELGVGFSFVRQNYHLEVDGTDFYLDMLFYHLKLRCFIVIQLEMGEFKPEHSGMMNFYLSGIDEREREEQDHPTIGIILCKTKGKTIAEYSLRHLRNPIAIAEHRLPKVLPSTERLQSELDSAVRMLEVEGGIREVKAQPGETTAAWEKLAEVALEIQRLLKLLEASNPMATDPERQAFVTVAIPTTLRQQAVDALHDGFEATVETLLEDSYVDLAIAVIAGWQQDSGKSKS
ncbi:MAG: PDDEXK nuclease domain-containing protein [Cyanobacteria bacterium J06639_14]